MTNEDDKLLADSKRFLNYLKAVKNIVPTFGENDNTNKLINLMEQLKKSDTQGIVNMMHGINDTPGTQEKQNFNSPDSRIN